MSILKTIGIVLFLGFLIVLILFNIGWAIILYALDHGWDKKWIDKEERDSGNY